MTTLLLKLFVKDYQNTSDLNVRKNYGLLGSFFGLITNLLLFLGKIVIGVLLGLYSIVTDSMNNLSDFGNNMVSIIGVKASAKKADKEHPYGHQRVEYILSLIIGVIVIGLSMVMCYNGILETINFFVSVAKTSTPPQEVISYPLYVVSLCVLSFAILAKLLQAYLYFSLGKRIDSMPLRALGKDARNDIVATLFVIVGLIINWFTSFKVDCFFTIVVAVFVALSGIGIMKEAISSLIGEKPSEEVVDGLVALIKRYPQALGFHDLFLHEYGKLIYGTIHVEVDDSIDINATHMIIDEIEERALDELNIHLTIHMDPVKIHDPMTEKIRELVNSLLKDYEIKNLSIHDLHVFESEGKEHIYFEIVLPDEQENQETEDKLRTYLNQGIAEVITRPYFLKIGFDNEVQDFLSRKD